MISTGLVMGSGLSVNTPTLNSLSSGNLVINSVGTTEIQKGATAVGIFASTSGCLRILNNTIYGNVPCVRIDNSVNDYQYSIICNATSFSANSFFQLFQINGTTTVGSIIYNGTITNYNSTSDRRVKEDILYDWNGLEVVSKLKPVIYNRITDQLKRRIHGFIAQDVDEYYPQYVTPPQPQMGDPYYSMDYSTFVPIVTKCIQEQQSMIIEQEQQIKKLEDAITESGLRLSKQEETINTLLAHLTKLTEQVNQITLKMI
jgi:uncharacterized coiled-coil protein SlyX